MDRCTPQGSFWSMPRPCAAGLVLRSKLPVTDVTVDRVPDDIDELTARREECLETTESARCVGLYKDETSGERALRMRFSSGSGGVREVAIVADLSPPSTAKV